MSRYRLARLLLELGRTMDVFSAHLPQLADAGLVVLLSGLIGFEREAKHRPAGLRTHILVGLATWLFVEVGLSVTERFIGADSVTPDPIRIVQAVVYGISFIGAGTIFSASGSRSGIVGLTTAATLLATTAIAVSIGFGERFLGCAITVVILVVLVALGAVERKVGASKSDS